MLRRLIIPKASNVALVIRCGGLWFANGKFGCTWRLLQGVVKPKKSMKGRCLIQLSGEDMKKMEEQRTEDSDDDNEVPVEMAEDSDDEASEQVAVEEAVNDEIVEEAKKVAEEVVEEVAPPPKKKKVVRKKKVSAE